MLEFWIVLFRTRQEVQEVRQNRDPITSFREKLVSSGLATAEELKVCSNFISSLYSEIRHISKAICVGPTVLSVVR